MGCSPLTIDRVDWLQHMQSIVRSRHSTWLPGELDGEPVEVAMAWVLTDVRHICKLAGNLVRRSAGTQPGVVRG